MSTVVALAVAAALLAGTLAVALYMWREVGDVSIGLLGWLVIGGGVVGTLALAGVLVWLMHISARRGYDDAVGRDD